MFKQSRNAKGRGAGRTEGRERAARRTVDGREGGGADEVEMI